MALLPYVAKSKPAQKKTRNAEQVSKTLDLLEEGLGRRSFAEDPDRPVIRMELSESKLVSELASGQRPLTIEFAECPFADAKPLSAVQGIKLSKVDRRFGESPPAVTISPECDMEQLARVAYDIAVKKTVQKATDAVNTEAERLKVTLEQLTDTLGEARVKLTPAEQILEKVKVATSLGDAATSVFASKGRARNGHAGRVTEERKDKGPPQVGG